MWCCGGGPFPGIGQAGDSHEEAIYINGVTGYRPTEAEWEAVPHKALGKVWLEDALWLEDRRADAQRGQRLSRRDMQCRQESRSGYHSTATLTPPIEKPGLCNGRDILN